MTNACYRDYFHVDAREIKAELQIPKGKRKGPRGGVAVPFPVKLYTMLEGTQKEGLEHIVSWQSHGRCFMVHEPTVFVEDVLPRYFRQSKLTSFQRQLNLYGFQRVVNGDDRGGYYHELFLRGRADLATIMLRTRVKGSLMKHSPVTGQDPDFYALPACKDTCHANVIADSTESSDEGSTDDNSVTSSRSGNSVVPVTCSSTPSTDMFTPPITTPGLDADESCANIIELGDMPDLAMSTPWSDSSLTSLPKLVELPSSSPPPPKMGPLRMPPKLTAPPLPLSSSSDMKRRSDSLACFEGRTFTCIDDCSLQAMESILIQEEEPLIYTGF